MTFARTLLLLMAITLAGSSPSQAADSVVSRKRALTAPVADLARQMLGSTGAAFVELERPTYARYPDDPPGGLRFASRPRSAGEPGLCEATVAYVSNQPLYDGPFPSPPITTYQVYKAVDDLSPLSYGWSDAYEAGLSRKCAEAGRVLPPDNTDFGQEAFFKFESRAGRKVWFGASVLQEAIRKGRDASIEVACSQPTAYGEPDRKCDAPASILAGLQLKSLLSVEVVPCGNKANVSCVIGHFLRGAENNEQSTWELTVEVYAPESDAAEVLEGKEPDPIRIDSVTLFAQLATFD